LAVLPLRNLSADPTQEYFADSMTDELITYISQINGVRVISYASIYPYKDTKKSLPVIARELGVDAIVEGSVQHAGNRVRVNAQLISAPQETHLWAQSYDRDLQDALTLQSTLAGAIADQVKIKLTPSQQARLQASHPVNLKALEAYLQGDHHLSKVGGRFSAEEAWKAIAYFQQAVQEDPTFAAAYLKICQVYESQAILFSKADRWPAQKAAAEKALSLDPNLSGAHLAVGMVKFAYEWDLPAARAEFERALELDPNNAAAHDALGDLLEFTNHADDGWREHQVAQELDPGGDHFTATFFRTRQHDRAIELLRKRAELKPDDGGVHYSLSHNYAQLGMQKEHVAEFQQTANLYGYPEVADAVGRSYARHGYQAALREMARQMEHYYSVGQFDRPVQVAIAYAQLGDKDKVLNWLERAYTDHDEDLMYAFPEAELDFVRSEPRFRALEQKLGLPQ
jgi:TolB-like protein/Flp pilus assembly protein TadD